MKILFPNGSIHYPPVTGPDVHRYQLVRWWREQGHEVVTLSPDQNPLAEVRPKGPVTFLRSLRWADVVYLRPNERPDAVTRLTLWPQRWLIPKQCAVMWEQNRAITRSLSMNSRTKDQIKEDVAVFRRAARRVDAAFGVSQQVSDELRTLLGLKHVFTIQNGSDPEMFRPDVEPMPGFARGQTRLQVAWTGSLAGARHGYRLIQGLSQEIDQRALRIDIHVFGATAELFPKPRPACLQIHGPVSYFDLPRYLAGIDVGLVVYDGRTDGQSPLKLFDFMASGCVPVCTEGQPIEEVVRHKCEGLVKEWTPDTLADALDTLQKNSQIRLMMSKAARSRLLQAYTWQRVAERASDLMTSAVERRRGS